MNCNKDLGEPSLHILFESFEHLGEGAASAQLLQ